VTAWVVWASKVTNALLGFAISIVIARALGPDGRAEYFLASTVAVGVFAACHLSLDQAIFWAVAEHHATIKRIARTLAPVAALTFGATIAVFLLLTQVGHLLADIPQSTAFVAAFLAPIMLLNFLAQAILYAIDKARWASFVVVGTAVLQLLGVVAVAAADQLTSTNVLVISGLTTLVGALANFGMVLRHTNEGDHDVDVPWRSLVGMGLRNHPAVICLWLALRADVIIVAALVSKHDLGLYSLAVTLAEAILFASDALAVAALGRHRTMERQASVTYSVEVASTAARVAAAQVVAVAAFGWPLILLAYGRSWLGAYPPLVCLAPGTIALAYMRPLGAGFIRANRPLERSMVMAVAAVVNVIGAYIGARELGIVGAAVGSTIAYTIGALLLGWRVRISLGVGPWTRGRPPDAAVNQSA
jgi:O-antigen/teichoic acid export membrane protein